MTTVIEFPRQQQRRLPLCCHGCAAPVLPGTGIEIEVPSMKLQGEPVSVLCSDCYEATPSWVWAAE